MTNAIIPLRPDTFQTYVEANQRTMQSMGKAYGPHSAYMACQKHKIIVPPGSLNSSAGRKYDDAMAAAFAHCLPFYDRHGDDAVDLVAGELVPCELKLSYFDPQSFFVNAKDILMVKGAAKSKSFESCANAHYEIMYNAESKRRRTHYVLADDRTNAVIDMFTLDADSAYYCVTHYSNGDLRKKTEHKAKISVGLRRFQEMGTLHRPANIHVQGIDAWTDGIKQFNTPLLEHTFTGKVRVGNTEFSSKEEAIQFLTYGNSLALISHIQQA